MNFHPNEIKSRIGENIYNDCLKYSGTKYAYKPFCVLLKSEKYTNFRDGYPIFEMPYIQPTANKYLPNLK